MGLGSPQMWVWGRRGKERLVKGRGHLQQSPSKVISAARDLSRQLWGHRRGLFPAKPLEPELGRNQILQGG